MTLDQKTAKKRAASIRKNSIEYNLHLILEPDKYHGIAEITFILDNLNFSQYLELDFTGKIIEGLLINNLQVQEQRTQNFILLPKSCLQKGKNRLSILYQCTYDNDHSGLISFVDDNKEQFVYTDFEPYFANRMFPCFDQPNLKARMTLTVISQNPWVVLSHDKPTSIEPIVNYQDSFKSDQQSKHMNLFFKKIPALSTTITKFPRTQLMPTYILCLAAGNYYEIPSVLPGVPMSLYCPLSIIDTVNKYSSFIFDITSKCMALFETKFETDYPFSKYDQIFIRESKALAMENAGLVTLNEPFCLPRENATQYEYYCLALLVSHELSHHWFGNYVTMTWWDDVWLNESFAEWVSCYILEELLKTKPGYPFDQSYFYFRDTKIGGYIQDERNTATHPIRGVVSNTDDAYSVFDGITYEKGAATLKQLVYMVGQDNFFKALKSYFDRFQWDNATIDDLLDDLTEVFPSTQVSLTDWKKVWLEQPSLNVFRINWDRANHKFTINQSSFDGLNVLRPHKIKIALFKTDGKFDVIQKQLILATPTTQIVYDGSIKYTAILLNHDDQTFVQNIIDPVSLSFFMENIDQIQDLFTRMMVWYNIRSMVNIAQISISDYVNFVKTKLPSEPSNFIVDRMLQSLYQYLSKFINQNDGNALKRIIWHMVYTQLRNVADSEKERIQILQNHYIQYARSQLQLYNLQQWLYNKHPSLKKRIPDFKQKWTIVKKLYTHPSLTIQQKKAAFTQVYAVDFDTFRIGEAETVCKILLANEAEFQAIYQQFKGQTISITEKAVKIEGWRNAYHADWLNNKYLQRYFDDIITVSSILSYDQFEFFYKRLAPINYNFEYQIQRYKSVIAALQAKGNMKEHVKNIRKLVDDLTQRIQNTMFNAEIDNALSRQRAIFRESYISKGSISYNYHITFVKVDNYYTGMAEISFFLQDIPLTLPLDFVYDLLYAVKVNGVDIIPNPHGQFLYISGADLQFGDNFISIHYWNKYNNDGLGCMSFIETDTAKQYIYTKFEPYGAHRFIPCFDQPDLKAKAIFNVIVPMEWKVIGNQADTYNAEYDIDLYKQKVETRDEALLNSYLQSKSGVFFTLAATQQISTYLYCIIAGQYHKVSATADQEYRKIPMNLYCIQSNSPSLDRLAPFIFEMTTLSLELYERIFNVPYQFHKYDSVFCHQFKSGAMENPGVITFNDTYLYPDQVSLQKMVQFAATIVHENSHNWFGNYVTMKWWDDLWLNESFADFIANYCLQNIKGKVKTIDPFNSGWKFFLIKGVAGYREDQITETTHAVRSTVQNTSIATTYFDRITYQKGSATLKQLMFLMGEDKFFKGVKDYFDAFKWSNGNIDDFLGKMQTYFDSSNFTLNDWKQSWLLTPSLNTVEIQWDPSDISPTATLKIKQNYYSPVYPQLRYHKTKIAFFFDDPTKDPTLFEVLLTPDAVTTLQYDGSNNYKAVLVNAEYWSYFKYTIDPVSLQYFQDNLNKIPDALTRTIIWHDINEQMRDAKYKIKDFVDLFQTKIFQQTDDKIFENEYAIMKDVVNSYTPIIQRGDLKSTIFNATYQNLITYPGKSDKINRVKLLKDQLTIFASTDDQIYLLDSWMTNINPDLTGLEITILQTCDVLKLFYTLDSQTPQIKYQRFMDQSEKIGSTKGQLTLNTCNTIIASQQQLDNVYSYFKDMTRSLDVKLSYGEGWSYLSHLALNYSKYKKQYFADLPIQSGNLNSNHFESFYQNLKPYDDNLEETISEYGKIKLEGANMIGHMKVLTQIRYNYQLRSDLYAANRS